MNLLNRIKQLRFSRKFFLMIPFLIVVIFLVIIPTIFILVYALTPINSQSSISSNYSVMNQFIWGKVFTSFWIALVTVILSILIAYPLCYFLAESKNVIFKSVVMLLLTAPMWCSLLVKLIGIKSFFDIINGYSNSTFGNFYSLIGMVYIYLPFMLMPLYSSLSVMPKSLVQASQDLGYNKFKTFFNIVIPYTKTALLSGISLIFLPCFTTVAVPQFLNNANNNDLIGDIIFDIGNAGISNKVDLILASSISLIVIIIAFIFFLLIRVIPFLVISIYNGTLKQKCIALIKYFDSKLFARKRVGK